MSSVKEEPGSVPPRAEIRARRVYERPQLVDYGPIAHLTRGDGQGNDFDGSSNMAMIMSASM